MINGSTLSQLINSIRNKKIISVYKIYSKCKIKCVRSSGPIQIPICKIEWFLSSQFLAVEIRNCIN